MRLPLMNDVLIVTSLTKKSRFTFFPKNKIEFYTFLKINSKIFIILKSCIVNFGVLAILIDEV